MKNSFVTLALAGVALAKPMPQAVSSAIAPEASAPSGCSDSSDGEFQITVVNVTSSSSKRNVERRQLSGTLECKLDGGVLIDQADRIGYIASNYQFQFDAPPQAGALFTAGFSLCSNNSLALGGSAVFYQCYSGGFYNLYDRDWADQCSPVYLVAINGDAPAATQLPDGQPALTSQASAYPSQAPSEISLSQLPDGQPQVPTAAPAPVISQISDGQPQAPTAAPGPVISQITDGQPQVPTAAPALPAPVISQISDGQPQVPTAAPAPSGPIISQISDGQPQVSTAAPVSQISDGQIQVPTGGVLAPSGSNYTLPNATASSPPQYTGAAATPVYGLGVLAAGMIGVAALL